MQSIQHHTKDERHICSACGTSPVSHKFLFFSNLLEETVGRLFEKIGNIIVIPIAEKTIDKVEKILFRIGNIINIITFSKDRNKAVTDRSGLIWDEAIDRKIPMEQVLVFGKPIESYRAKINGKYHYFHSLPIPPHLPKDGQNWIDDKFKLFDALKKEKVPVPKTVKIVRIEKAKRLFDTIQKPVIIKPKNGSRGRHTTTNINTVEDLEKAIRLCREISLFMVMQEHLEGIVYRATVINKKLVGFYKAEPPFVIGDGHKTVKKLIEEKNKKRNERISDILINDDLISFIERSGCDLDKVIEQDKKLYLSAKTGRMYGGYTKEMFQEIHPKLHPIFEKAGEIIRTPVAGFDLIMEDPTKDPDTQRWGIIECNSLPFIDLHYFALEGKPINLAKNVWDLWE